MCWLVYFVFINIAEKHLRSAVSYVSLSVYCYKTFLLSLSYSCIEKTQDVRSCIFVNTSTWSKQCFEFISVLLYLSLCKISNINWILSYDASYSYKIQGSIENATRYRHHQTMQMTTTLFFPSLFVRYTLNIEIFITSFAFSW